MMKSSWWWPLNHHYSVISEIFFGGLKVVTHAFEMMCNNLRLTNWIWCMMHYELPKLEPTCWPESQSLQEHCPTGPICYTSNLQA